MGPRREGFTFAIVLGILVAGFFSESLFGGKVLSPADVLFVSASFRGRRDPSYESANRLLMDPVLQFQPWLEFNRAMLRNGRLPLWNPYAGCGAPHLANGQSAVFDPFHLIAYVGELPRAHAWMAAARLWIAGLGAFLLARAWGFGRWGRWFAGLAFPFCGFLVVWLLFPVTSVAVWLPWLIWASDRALDRPGAKSVAGLALITSCVLLGGHVQTSAHVLLAVATYAAWRLARIHREGSIPSQNERATFPQPHRRVPRLQRSAGEFRGEPGYGSSVAVLARPDVKARVAAPAQAEPKNVQETGRRPALLAANAWCAGIVLGVMIAAVEVLPLADYLTRSPVWADRALERKPVLALVRPRLLDAVCTALPYAFGSQRRGQPNLARALGVHNLNESAGGFAGLATLIWLAPLGWSVRRRVPQVYWLGGLTLFGALGAFGVPPVDNLLRAIPVLNVTDNRRLTLWLAFGLVFLGGAGMDALGDSLARQRRRRGVWLWITAAICLCGAALVLGQFEPKLRARSIKHYARAAALTPGADPAVYRARANRQATQTVTFLPRYYFLAAAQLGALAFLAVIWRRRESGVTLVRSAALGLTLADLLGFGLGLNPAIDPRDDRPESEVIAYLRHEVGASGRALGVGEELPPNTLMRYGLSDVRNYDSVELARSLDWFAPLYPRERGAQTSRREVTWAGVARSLDRLTEASVAAVVGASPPERGLFARVDRVGGVWIARLDRRPLIDAGERTAVRVIEQAPGYAELTVDAAEADRIISRETFDQGWRAWVDGRETAIKPERGTFIAVTTPRGRHRVVLRYDPPVVNLAIMISLTAGLAALFGLTTFRPFRSTRSVASGLGRTQALGLQSVV
jgi:hypothetical protein